MHIELEKPEIPTLTTLLTEFKSFLCRETLTGFKRPAQLYAFPPHPSDDLRSQLDQEAASYLALLLVPPSVCISLELGPREQE